MGRGLRGDEQIGNRRESWKARQDVWSVVVPVAVELDGEKDCYFRNRTAFGQRPDGSSYGISLHDDNSQNVCLQQGAKINEGVACVIIHLSNTDREATSVTRIVRPVIWAFGGDKWESLKMLGAQNTVGKELLITAKRGGEKYQDLAIQYCPDHLKIMHTLADDEKTRLVEDLNRLMEQFRAMMRQDSREDQLAKMAGQAGGGASQSISGSASLPQGVDLTGTGISALGAQSPPPTAPGVVPEKTGRFPENRAVVATEIEGLTPPPAWAKPQLPQVEEAPGAVLDDIFGG